MDEQEHKQRLADLDDFVTKRQLFKEDSRPCSVCGKTFKDVTRKHPMCAECYRAANQEPLPGVDQTPPPKPKPEHQFADAVQPDAKSEYQLPPDLAARMSSKQQVEQFRARAQSLADALLAEAALLVQRETWDPETVLVVLQAAESAQALAKGAK